MIKQTHVLSLFCDEPSCKENDHGPRFSMPVNDDFEAENEHEARLAARAFGWTVSEARSSTSHDERVYCPKCTRKRVEVRP